MACDPENVVTSAEMVGLKADIATIDDVVESALDTTTTKSGTVVNTLNGQLKLLGYQVPVTYAGSIVFTTSDGTKTVDEAGVIYAPLPSALPFTTSGTWGGDDDARFFVVQGITTSGLQAVKPFSTLADAVADTLLVDGDALSIAERKAGKGGGGKWKVVLSSTVAENTYNIVQCTGVGTLSLVLIMKEGKIWPAAWGVDVSGDGTESTGAMQFIADYTATNLQQTIEFEGNSKVTVSDVIQFKQTVNFIGNQVQIYQNTTAKGCLLFGDNLTGGGNYRNGYQISDIMAGNVDKTATCIEYRNINNSNIVNVFAVGGLIGQHLRGCILSNWTRIAASTQYNGVPGFFGTVGGIDEGILLESYEGLACNENVFKKPWGLGCAVSGMDVSGANNTIIGHDFEGIESPADHLILDGKTVVIGGDIEGTGGGLVVNSGASYSHITGLNNLSFLSLNTGCYGVYVGESIIKNPVVNAGTSNCIIQNIKVNTGGAFTGVQAGTDNIVQNVFDINTGLERGLNRSGTFTPILEFGGGSTGATWSQQRGEYIISPHGGGMCHFKVQLQINAKSSDTGTATINLNDIPFAAKNDSLDTLLTVKYSGVATGSGSYPSANLTFNTKTVKLQSITEAAGIASNLDDTDFATTDSIWVTGSYFI